MPADPSVTVHRGSAAVPARAQGPVLTIGNFDGVHRGHRHLLDATRALAAELGVPSAVLTFDPPPMAVLRPDAAMPRIQTLDEKLEALGAAGVDEVVVEPFDLGLAAMEPDAFATTILRENLAVSGLVLGYDFRFGRRRAGTVDDLHRVLGVPIRQVEALLDDGPISSSRIRSAVHEGELALAARLLGRPHRLVGAVEGGDRRGRQLGFPTANVRPHTSLTPPFGVYAVRVELDGTVHDGVANWGIRPMWELAEPLLEVHLLDFEGDLYGRELGVDLVARLRGEARFDSIEALEAAIRADVAHARQVLA